MENDKQAHKISPKSGRGLGHMTSTIFGSTVGYPSDSLASCLTYYLSTSIPNWPLLLVL